MTLEELAQKLAENHGCDCYASGGYSKADIARELLTALTTAFDMGLEEAAESVKSEWKSIRGTDEDFTLEHAIDAIRSRKGGGKV